MEAGGGRRRKGQRVLYFFRTPPGVRVGREPIDEAAMRLLEQHNPDVSFEWERLLAGASSSATSSGAAASSGFGGAAGSRDERRPRRERRGRPENPRPSIGRQAGEAPRTASREATAGDPIDAESAATLTPPPDMQSPDETVGGSRGPEDAEYEAGAGTSTDAAPPDAPVAERYARLGAEGVRRLRTRYADTKERLLAREMDEADRTVALSHLERLNPDAWETDEAVAKGLEEYESLFEAIRPLVGRQPRRRS